MFKKEKGHIKEYTKEELQDILAGVKKLSMEELASVVGGAPEGGDDRESYSMDMNEINRSIFGAKFYDEVARN